MIVNTPKPPYVAAIFTSTRTAIENGYEEMDAATFAEIQKMEDYLGFEAFRNEKGFCVNISYWKDLNSLMKWRNNLLHQKAQEFGKEKWYQNYKLRICTVERDYEFSRD